MDGRPWTALAQWNGESRGRWEGNTLAVESRYFPDRSPDRFRHIWRAPTADLRVLERFTRVEFACHEGNYALGNVLRGARAQDAARPPDGSAGP